MQGIRATIVDSIDDAVVVTDRSRVVVAWNTAMEALMGCPRTDALGAAVDDVLIALPSAAWRLPIAEAIAGRGGRGPAVGFDQDGRARQWLEPRWAARADEPGAVLTLRDVTEQHKRALFVRALETVGRSLTSSLDLDRVLDTIVGTTTEMMGADAAMVVSWDQQEDKLILLRAAGRITNDYAPGGFAIGGGPIGVAVREARAVTTADVLADPRWHLADARRERIAREGFRAVAAAPLIVKGDVQGALVVLQWTARTVSDEEMAVLGLLAEQAALALENARLYADAHRRAERLRELAQLEHMVAASLDPDAVLRAIAGAAARLVGADIVQVWTADPVAKVLRLRASSQADDLPPVRDTIPFGDGITGRVAVDKQVSYIADITREPDAVTADWARESGIHRLLSVPILSGDELLGVVSVRSRSESLASDEDRALITTLAAQAAVAVQNAGAYADAVSRGTRLSALAAVTRSITASLDTKDVLRRIVEATSAMRPGALAAVHMVDERGVMHATASSDTVSLPLDRPFSVGFPRMVMEERRPVLVADPVTHPRTQSPQWWSARPGSSYYGVPIAVGSTLVGVLDYVVPDGVPDREEQEALNLLAAHAGIAIRNASLYQTEHLQSTRIRALAGVNQQISSTLDLDDLLRIITENAATLTGVRFALFWVANDEQRTLTFKSHSDAQIAAGFPRYTLGYDDGAPGWIARHHAPLIVDDVFADHRVLMPEWWRAVGLRSFAGYPVLAEGELLAILALCHTQPVNLTPATRDLIDMFLAQASVAIRNARLYREARRRRDVAEALARLGRGLSGTLDVDHIAKLVVSGAVELFGARGGAVYRYEPGDDSLRTVFSEGPGREPGRALVIRPGEGIAGRAIHDRRIVVSPDILHDSRVSMPPALREEIERLGHRVVVGVPLLGTRSVVGALVVRFELGREFGTDETQALQAFADQAALALENARVYAASQRERREATALADLARRLALSLDLDEVGDRLVEAVIPTFNAHTSTLYRVGSEGELAAVATGGAGRGVIGRQLVWPKGTGMVGRVVDEGRAMWTRDFMSDPTFDTPPHLLEAVARIGSRAVLAAPLNAKGRVIGAIIVAFAETRDIEEREVTLLQAFADHAALALENAQLYASARHSVARLHDTQTQLVQAAKLSALGQLVSGVAHELNNPLAVIIGYGQLLLSREVPPPLRRPVELMVAQGDRMAKIVRNLLYFARQRPPERTAVYLQDLVEQTLVLRVHQLSLSGITVRREYTDGLPAISADAHQLQQVFLNLILNAEQAILGSGRGSQIVARTARGTTPDMVIVQVVDDGPGIPAENVARVFEPFYTTKEVGQGTGLGLSVSYGIVQEHGGRLTVESRPGATTFTVELPVHSALPPKVAQPVVEMPATVSRRPALVVEDEPAVLELMVTLLGNTGWEVDVASGGHTALEMVKGRHYDLIVSDMRMPEGAGDEFFLQSVAIDPALAGRFLFITGDTANPEAWRFLKETRVPVLEKPFAASAFLDAVRQIATVTTS